MVRFLVAICLAGAIGTAHAQSSEDQQARALFDAGRTAYDAGRFEQALRYFQESYDLSHRPALLFNIGSAADRLLQVDRALAAYRQYLAAVPNAPNQELAQSRIEFLQQHAGGGAVTPEPDHQVVVAPPQGGGTPRDTGPRGGGGSVTGEWWFWTLIGVLAVGAIVGVTAGIVVATSGPQAPLTGDTPIVMALEGAR